MFCLSGRDGLSNDGERWKWYNIRATGGEEKRNSIRWNKINGWMLRRHFEAQETITYTHGFALFKKDSFESETVKKWYVFIFRMETKRKTNLKLKSIIHFSKSVCEKVSERKMERQKKSCFKGMTMLTGYLNE